MAEVIELRAGDYRARIDLTGAGLQSLTCAGRDLVWPYTRDSGPVAFQGQVLAPWPNRVGGGRYSFAGQDYRLEVNNEATGTAIHGLVYDREWSPVAVTDSAVTLRLDFDGTTGFPFPLELSLTYALSDTGLTVTTGATNSGSGPAPFGLGFHPYLTLGEPVSELAARGEVDLEITADSHLPVDANKLPTGPPEPVEGDEKDFRSPGRALGETVLDHAFTDLSRDGDGRAWVRLIGPEHRVEMWCDASFTWFQVFSSDHLSGSAFRANLAAEPMTCPPNALATGEGLIVLEPGESTEHTFGITTSARG
ncbi:aldose 1-epimerase family protein [Nocardiopsis sp. YSL2]|uniref:aldose 1-epimerase family protein n=1 Tax=Nocardiopsis sp. YSL2 TaxID=2939492 RepID=UPI0026F42117|nr:aldose 1-epimerase family protein [Nocardiopsis sp. YSL2]